MFQIPIPLYRVLAAVLLRPLCCWRTVLLAVLLVAAVLLACESSRAMLDSLV